VTDNTLQVYAKCIARSYNNNVIKPWQMKYMAKQR